MREPVMLVVHCLRCGRAADPEPTGSSWWASHSMSTPESWAVTSALPWRVTMWPSTWPALICVPSARSGSGSNVPATVATATTNAMVGSWLGAVPWREIRSVRRLEVVGGVERDDLGAPVPLSSRLTSPARVPAGGSSMTAGDAEVGQGAHAQVPPHRRGDLGDQAGQHAWRRR